MEKKRVTKFLSIVLAAVCIASSCPAMEAAAEENIGEFSVNEIISEEDFAEPEGGVMPDEATPISEEEAQELHELFQDLCGIEAYSAPEVNNEYVSNYGYSTLTTSQEQTCYAEIKTKAYQFHEQQQEAILRQSKDSDGNVTNEYYVWAEFFISEYGLNVEQVQKVLFAVEADCPELFWFSGSFTYTHVNGLVTKLYPKIETDYIESEIRKQTQDNIDAGIQPYLTAIDQAKKAGADDMEMELLIHDMILEAVDYEYIPGTMTPQSAAYAHSIAGFFDGTGVVCEGYAKSFQLLMTYAGVDSIYAVGYANGGGHAWNLVCIDGEWYNIDLTWNDMGQNVAYNDGIRYRYYNCSTDSFGNHVYMPNVFKGMYDVPETNGDTYNYFHYYGLYVTPEVMADETAFLEFMANAVEQAGKRGDYLLQFAFDSTTTRTTFLEYVENYEAEFLECISDDKNVYKLAGTSTQSSGSPYIVYFPMLRIYADTYEVEYNGQAAELTFHMVKGRREVAQEGNYQVIYFNNNQVGQAKAIVSGLGTYTDIGENEFIFYITENAIITVTPELTAAPQPTATVTPKPTATVTPKLTATPQPTATVTPEPTATPQPTATAVPQPSVSRVSGLKLVSVSANAVKIQFTKQASAKGYEVVLYQGSKQKQKIITTKTTYTFKKLSAATAYTVKVRAYTEQGGIKVYGSYSKTLKTGTATKAPTIKSVKKGNNQAVISWKKVSNASGYEIYMSNKKSSGYTKIATVKKASTVKYTKKKLQKGKTYYFKVRTYRTVGGKKIYSSYSKVKSTKL